MHARLAALLSALGLLAAGCATGPSSAPSTPGEVRVIEAPEPPPVVEPLVARPMAVPPVDETSRALSYFDRLRRMQPPELAREQESVRAAYNRSHEDADRMRLAMLYALPNSSITDEARALELLEPLVKTPAHALHPVAVLLSTYVHEQKRLTQSALALQKDVQTLQQKLDALRSLERALSEREGAAPRRR